MTIEYAATVLWKYGGSVVGNLSKLSLSTSASEEKKEGIDYSKKIESVTTAIILAVLGMTDGEPKVGVLGNRIKIYPTGSYCPQGFSRYLDKVDRLDLKKYKVLHTAITVPQQWYNPESDEAKAIMRIQRVSMLGLQKLKKIYEDDFVPEHVDMYIKCYRSYKLNHPDEDPKKYPELIDDAPLKPNEKPIIKTINKPDEKPIEKSDEESIEKKDEKPDEKSIEKPDDVSSEISSDDTEEQKQSMHHLYELMKSIWKKEDLLVMALRIEEAYELHEKANKLHIEEKCSAKDAIAARDAFIKNKITPEVNTKVQDWIKALKDDQNSRYCPID
ncbi:MAG: hypothetical protein VX777_01095 [Chlamydiota bacterium]|nr:hypothetical protein [Chlamydiota bacterium]